MFFIDLAAKVVQIKVFLIRNKTVRSMTNQKCSVYESDRNVLPAREKYHHNAIVYDSNYIYLSKPTTSFLANSMFTIICVTLCVPFESWPSFVETIKNTCPYNPLIKFYISFKQGQIQQ